MLSPMGGDNLDLEEFVVNLENSIQVAHEAARAHLRTTEERMGRDYDLRVRFRAYQGERYGLCFRQSHHEGKMS